MPYASIGRALIVAAALAFPAGAGAQTMYKWVDEKGVTHFSEDPPPVGTKGQKFEPKVTPPSSSVAPPAESPDKWKGQEAEFRKRQLERDKHDAADARTAEQRAQKCSEARRRLGSYTDRRIYRDNEDGTRNYLNDAERDQAIQRQRDLVREYCA